MTRRLILARHGQTLYNATQRMQGQLDTALSPEGEAQASEAARLLVGRGIARIVASDLERAARTARIIAEELGLPVTTDPRLRETHLGRWQGKTHREVDAAHPGARAAWRHDASWAPPGGESRLEVARRARPVIEELMARYAQWDDAAVLVVAHGGTIAALTGSLLDLNAEQYPLLSGLNNAHWAQLTARPRFIPGGTDALDPGVLPRREDATVAQAQWYLDAWNMGA
ncbi:histidine phosphatase family protein [Corynebacterium sp. zg-331]|uniref:histidine phosphatase family protein n=1 Tax=unclassified Corynebacterium TaxID=2624378 RepID=UPI00128CFFCC|nr:MULTISPECIES: histidine phosphatase family protein [unclassified Corynebacterium]MBC3185071.1 histidine phosphatase family protein [Corynebacterium sp. zg-331]MPV51571.1 histidine phosphatase family protein [Corynebacterium sp. zg331]